MIRVVVITLAVVMLAPMSAHGQATPEPLTAAEVCARYGDAAAAATPVTDPESAGDPIDVTTLEFDLLFLDAMIPHHELAIEMAVVVRDRSERSELLALADAIVQTQQAELDAMVGWRAGWYPDIPSLNQQQLIDGMNARLSENPGMGGGAGLVDMDPAHMVDQLVMLCQASEDLDIEFIDVMVAHHSSAVILSRESSSRATHRETMELAGAIASTQQFEIDQMLAWRADWFTGTPVPNLHGD